MGYVSQTFEEVSQVEEKKAVSMLENGSQEEDDSIPVPSKRYNLGFLDKLDDPSFNPFASKTSIKDTFETTVTNASELSEKKVPEDLKIISETGSENKMP